MNSLSRAEQIIAGIAAAIAVMVLVMLILLAVLISRVPSDLNDDIDKGPLNVCVQNVGAGDCQSAPRADNQ